MYSIKKGKINKTLDSNNFNKFAQNFASIVKNKKLIFIGDAKLETINIIESNIIKNFLSFGMETNNLISNDPVRIRDLRNLNHKKAYLINKYSKAQNSLIHVCMIDY